MPPFFVTSADSAIPIQSIRQKDFSDWLGQQNAFTQNWFASRQFRAEPGSTALVPDAQGGINQVICYVADQNAFWRVGHLPMSLPEGVYRFVHEDAKENDAIVWGLGSYQFSRYKKPSRQPAKLLLTEAQAKTASLMVETIHQIRDWINTPTDDLGPSEFAADIVALAHQYGADITQIIGEDLLRENYPAIHTVGRASDDAPRLVDLRWGDPNHPKVTLVGKGVCFDTGGLDIKPASAMLQMKKDMGGAAHVLGLARLIMATKLPIRLRVLVPLVENAIAGNAYRPGDVIRSRSGLTIEVGNTDAEGRLILADALTEAASEKPELLIDMSTLTGAARIALGTELPALFANDDSVADALIKAGINQQDPIWRLPLFAPYRDAINSQVADLNNNTADAYAGAITAALFLQEFVPANIPWLHFDLMAYNLKSRPGRPQGGEAMALRALWKYLTERYFQ